VNDDLVQPVARDSDEHRHHTDKPNRFNPDRQHLPRTEIPRRAPPVTRSNREAQDCGDDRRGMPQFIALSHNHLAQFPNGTHRHP